MVIALSGKKLSGKDTVADMLLQMVKPSCKIGFASALKQELARACGVSVEFIEDHKANFRLILQGWGTDYRRRLYGDKFWINKMEQALATLQNFKLIVVTDVRLLNEYEFMKKQGALMVRVERFTHTTDTHITETELDHSPFDIVIQNGGTLEDLKTKVNKLIQ